MIEQSQWITADQALRRLAPDDATWMPAARMLVQHAECEAIVTAAAKIVWVHEITGSSDNDSDYPPVDLWADAEYWTRENWALGLFESRAGGGYRVRAFDLRFDRDGVEAIAQRIGGAGAVATAATAIAQPARRGGNPGKIDEWHQFWLAAMTMLNEGKLHKAVYPTQAALKAALLSAINDGLSDASVKPQVQQIWHTFIDPPS